MIRDIFLSWTRLFFQVNIDSRVFWPIHLKDTLSGLYYHKTVMNLWIMITGLCSPGKSNLFKAPSSWRTYVYTFGMVLILLCNVVNAQGNENSTKDMMDATTSANPSNADPCDPNPCANEGTCSVGTAEGTPYSCQCTDGWSGPTCEVGEWMSGLFYTSLSPVVSRCFLFLDACCFPHTSWTMVHLMSCYTYPWSVRYVLCLISPYQGHAKWCIISRINVISGLHAKLEWNWQFGAEWVFKSPFPKLNWKCAHSCPILHFQFNSLQLN